MPHFKNTNKLNCSSGLLDKLVSDPMVYYTSMSINDWANIVKVLSDQGVKPSVWYVKQSYLRYFQSF